MDTDKQVTVRFTIKDMENIEAAVKSGHGMNVVDFVRSSTRKNILEIGIQPKDDKTVQVVFGGE